MIAKISKALYLARNGRGHEMNGHGSRCYIQNAKGHNIMRLSWVEQCQDFIVYGAGSRDITATVKEALARVVYGTISPSKQAVKSSRLGRLAALVGVGVALTGCQVAGAATVLFNVMGNAFI
jgi:hypothetical protein